MRRTCFGILLMLLLVFGPVAMTGAHEQPQSDKPRELLEEATRGILRAFELMLKSIPQYEAPEVLENGDIIIRRKRPKPDAPAPDAGDPGKTKI
ncbi:MAG: hypothetical protein IIC06_07735 [Proteobacteria bacterium]|nr:hypothetical protein [Pseudomonadota bacterium]